MIGGGDLYEDLQRQAQHLGLHDQVRFTNWLPIDEVNKEMASAHILLMTSNQREGWGMVVNEAINSGCMVVVNQAIGSAKWLVENGQTGLTYQQGNVEQMIREVTALCAEPEKLDAMARAGHQRLVSQWSAPVAAQRLTMLCGELLQGRAAHALFQDGPCSAAGYAQRIGKDQTG